MRKIEFDVYKFEELSDEAKKNAVEKMREELAELNSDSINGDYRRTLREFEKRFGLYRVEIDESGYSIQWSGLYADEFVFSYDEKKDEPIYLRKLHGKLLWRYLQNNIFPLVDHKKYYLWNYHTKDHKIKTRTSRITYSGDASYGLTGCWCDEPLIKPFTEWIKHPDDTTTYEDLVKAACDGFSKQWMKDVEYGFSDEYVTEELSERDLEFCEDGAPYNYEYD